MTIPRPTSLELSIHSNKIFHVLTYSTALMHSAQLHNVLLTGASGYLGGSLFAALKSAGLGGYAKIYALVRSDAQKEAVQQYGAEPLSVSLKDAKAVKDVVMQNKISVVFYLIDVIETTAQENLIKALGDLRQTSGQDVHFLHVHIWRKDLLQ
ncbi:hypothetical protein K4K59_004870 [Colletotrichum sp. SAR11_240]|nr:hypothetical protein K4K59_004870 [Colletotrichum sp. SAR11_240]